MIPTRIAVARGTPRAHVDLSVGTLAPRLISRDETTVHVAVAAAGMVLLGGDNVHIAVIVGEGCTLEVEDVGGTVAYPGAPSSWHLEVRIDAGGTLLWNGLPFVVTDGADVSRTSAMSLGSGGRAVVRETLVLGRYREAGGRLRSALSVTDAEGPMLVESLDVRGEHPEPGVLGHNRVLDSVLAVGFRPPTGPHDLELEAAGALARHLSDHTHASPLESAWERWTACARTEHPGRATVEATT